jgi:DNA-binding GntR family transcriptional regulator
MSTPRNAYRTSLLSRYDFLVIEGSSYDPRRYVRVHSVLSAEIRDGTIIPGETLRIGILAQRFSVSRDTMNHALRMLGADQLAQYFPGHGWIATLPEADKADA